MSFNYGHIEIKGDKIVRTRDNEIGYEIPIKDIRVIGEFTNTDGPYLDDWFLVIVTKDDWYEIPMDVLAINQLLQNLGELLGTKLEYQLTKSTKWKTRIMYPEQSRDKDLYEIVGVNPKTLWDRTKKIVGLQDTIRQFSTETKKWITE